MRIKNLKYVNGILLIAFLGALLSCATDKAPLQIENSLPQDELAYYNDSFEKMREDLWDRAGYLYREEQVQNFKQADVRFDNGKLILRTKTGSFSKGGLLSKYALRGNFDIRLHFRMNFKKGISGMDQLFYFSVYDKSLKIGEISFASIGLAMRGGLDRGNLFSNCVVNCRRKMGDSQKTENFNGWFRIQRAGKYISTLYKKRGTPEWTQMNTFCVTDNDMVIGFQLRNFLGKRTTIRANHSISAEFYSLKINAAKEIIEEEI